jgi:hypothetical protein
MELEPVPDPAMTGHDPWSILEPCARPRLEDEALAGCPSLTTPEPY